MLDGENTPSMCMVPLVSVSGGQNFTNPISPLRGPYMPRCAPTQQLTLLVGQVSKSWGLELYSCVENPCWASALYLEAVSTRNSWERSPYHVHCVPQEASTDPSPRR